MVDQKLVPVEMQAAICIRPLLKKEREDAVVLEAQSHSDEQGCGVALHPLPSKINGDSITPSAALILQTMSPDTIKTGHDEEFRFDHVFATDADELLSPDTTSQSSVQNQVYTRLGRPMALRAMELLVNNDDLSSNQRTTQLVVAMGSPGSGKSHVCWGPGPITKRKNAQDGFILRMVDSFFGQFDRLKTKSPQGAQHFALNLSFVQVSQDASGKTQNNCELYDLLQHARGSPRDFSPHVRALARWVPKKASYASTQGTEECLILEQDAETNDFLVTNQIFHACQSMEEARGNIQEALNNSRKFASRRRSQGHVLVQMQPVVLEKPRASAQIMKRGGMIAVLEMVGTDETDRKCNRRNRSASSLMNRSDAHSALIHCLRSLQYNEFIRMGKTQLADALDEAEDDDEVTKMSEITCSVMASPKKALQRQPSFKKVPFPRHKLTMLLQPFFSSTFTDETYVTLLMAASPGTRDYGEKKGLMQELEAFVNTRMGPTNTVMTGLVQRPNVDDLVTFRQKASRTPRSDQPKQSASTRKHAQPVQKPRLPSESTRNTSAQPPRPTQSTAIVCRGPEEDGKPEKDQRTVRPRGIHQCPTPKKVVPGVFCDGKKGAVGTPMIQTAASMTYSDTSEEGENVDLPPPVAPPPAWKSTSSARYLESPNASAPNETEVRGHVGFSGIHPQFSDDEVEGISTPPTAGQQYSSTTTYFGPVKHHLKKAVNVGKKKCGKVWEKMYTTTNNGCGALGSHRGSVGGGAHRSTEVEIIRRKLLDTEAERDSLRGQLESLRHENDILHEVENERNDLRLQVEKLEKKLGQQMQQLPTMETHGNDFMECSKSSTPSSRGYADIMAPSFPFVAEPKHDTPTAQYSTKSNENGRIENLSPQSRAYADHTAPSLPFSDHDDMYTTKTTTTTTTTATAIRPLTGNSLKAHMAKLTAAGPVLPSPAGTSWNNW